MDQTTNSADRASSSPFAARRALGIAVAVVGWLAIALLTLTPTGTAGDTPALCLTCGPGWLADFLANILLFIPLGAGLALAGVPLTRVAVLTGSTTVAVELFQWRLIAGRDASLADLLANFAGGMVGAELVAYALVLLFPPPRIAVALALAWSALWVGGTLTTAWALTPSLPDSLWWTHWNAVDSRPAPPPDSLPFVERVRLGGVPTIVGPVGDWARLRPLLLDGGVVDATVVLAGDRRRRETEIVAVDDADTESAIISFQRVHDGVAFYFRTRAHALGLRSPAVNSGPILRTGVGDTLHLAGSLSDGRLRLDIIGTAGTSNHTLALTPNLGWSFLLPFALDAAYTRFATMVWMVVLLLPVGWWASRGLRHTSNSMRALSLFGIGATFVTMLAAPPAFGLPLPSGTEWVAWTVGIVGGVLLARAATQTC